MKTTPGYDLMTAISFYTAAPTYIATVLAEDRSYTKGTISKGVPRGNSLPCKPRMQFLQPAKNQLKE